MLERGELRTIIRGAYIVGPIAMRFALETAAVLVSGPAAVLSHRSAAHLYELLPHPARPGPVDVTVPRVHGSRRPEIALHRTAFLKHYEIRERHGVPVTAPPRTLIDLAGVCDPAQLEQAVAESFAIRLTNRPQLLRACDQAANRRGVGRLRSVLDAGRGPQRTRSTPERVLLAALRGANLPEPEVNRRIGPWEVDFYWPEQGLVVEVDGYAAHSSPTAFERDRRKDAELAERGITVRRVSAKQVRNDCEDTVERVRAQLRIAASTP
jgi:very-short-patch-repair endonuclease